MTADVVLPDDLVSDEVLALASPSALVIPVGKRCGQPRITQAGIHALMLEHASPKMENRTDPSSASNPATRSSSAAPARRSPPSPKPHSL
jgi:hypothetical protein